jgi:hypothetical protein
MIRGGAFKGLRMSLDLAHQTQLYVGTFERETARWLQRLASGIQTAVDVGAAEGEYTLYFLLRTSATSVLAFEPSDAMRRQLTQNVQEYGRGSGPIEVVRQDGWRTDRCGIHDIERRGRRTARALSREDRR